MLDKVEPGRYRLEVQRTKIAPVYAFFRPRGRVCIVRHWVDNVDPWIRRKNDPDLNVIEVVRE